MVQTLYFGSIAVLQAAEFFPEFVKSRLSAALMFNIINRQSRTGDIDVGEKIVRAVIQYSFRSFHVYSKNSWTSFLFSTSYASMMKPTD